jgi:CRISPR type I-E-associated protein CasB/Cse2
MNKKVIEDFMTNMENINSDRGAMAKAERYVLAGDFITASSVVERFVPAFAKEWERKCFYVVAGLFAYHSAVAKHGNLGDTIRIIASKMREKAIEKRFLKLVALERDELLDSLFAMVSLAKSTSVSINYVQLLTDLIYWGDKVRHRWAISFYHNSKGE